MLMFVYSIRQLSLMLNTRCSVVVAISQCKHNTVRNRIITFHTYYLYVQAYGFPNQWKRITLNSTVHYSIKYGHLNRRSLHYFRQVEPSAARIFPLLSFIFFTVFSSTPNALPISSPIASILFFFGLPFPRQTPSTLIPSLSSSRLFRHYFSHNIRSNYLYFIPSHFSSNVRYSYFLGCKTL